MILLESAADTVLAIWATVMCNVRFPDRNLDKSFFEDSLYEGEFTLSVFDTK